MKNISNFHVTFENLWPRTLIDFRIAKVGENGDSLLAEEDSGKGEPAPLSPKANTYAEKRKRIQSQDMHFMQLYVDFLAV